MWLRGRPQRKSLPFSPLPSPKLPPPTRGPPSPADYGGGGDNHSIPMIPIAFPRSQPFPADPPGSLGRGEADPAWPAGIGHWGPVPRRWRPVPFSPPGLPRCPCSAALALRELPGLHCQGSSPGGAEVVVSILGGCLCESVPKHGWDVGVSRQAQGTLAFVASCWWVRRSD